MEVSGSLRANWFWLVPVAGPPFPTRRFQITNRFSSAACYGP
jgi:hypothetical protein